MRRSTNAEVSYRRPGYAAVVADCTDGHLRRLTWEGMRFLPVHLDRRVVREVGGETAMPWPLWRLDHPLFYETGTLHTYARRDVCFGLTAYLLWLYYKVRKPVRRLRLALWEAAETAGWVDRPLNEYYHWSQIRLPWSSAPRRGFHG